MTRTILSGLIAFVLGAGMGGFLVAYLSTPTPSADDNCEKGYPLTSSELDCDYTDAAARLDTLGTLLNRATSVYITQQKATRISVWVRDLVNKRWVASNELETYSPASLLKLPLVIAYYKFSELDPDVLNRTVVYTKQLGEHDPTLYFTKPTSLVEDQAYTVEDLLERAIIDSDNAAALMLSSNIEPSFYQKTLFDLGIQIPNNGQTLDYVTVKTYANIFRILYNASYLNRNLSEHLLELLTKSDYKGVTQPLTLDERAAHKFGERTVIETDGEISKRELHDCGIVYRKDRTPYSICVMTDGKNFEDLRTIIQDISTLVYKNI